MAVHSSATAVSLKENGAPWPEFSVLDPTCPVPRVVPTAVRRSSTLRPEVSEDLRFAKVTFFDCVAELSVTRSRSASSTAVSAVSSLSLSDAAVFNPNF